MRRVLIFFMLWLSALLVASSQKAQTRQLSLSDAITAARKGSVDAAAALDELRSAYWQHRIYRAGLLPELSFKATAPSFKRGYDRYQQSDGSYTFVRSGTVEASAALTLTQSVWLTGGSVSVTSSLDYMHQLNGDRMNSFLALPVAITFEQPLFAVNNAKWSRRIEPVRYREACARFLSQSEEVAMEAVRYFFNLLMARESLASSEQNLENARKLYAAARAKRDMGQISENDLLQIELTMLTAQSSVTENRSSVRAAAMQLGSFLGFDDGVNIEPVEPQLLDVEPVAYARALELANMNNPLSTNIKRRQLEADYELAKAKGAQREISLYAQIGFSGADNHIRGAYGNLHDNSIIEIGMSVPLLDWGRRKAALRMAESRRELTRNTLRKEETDFNQNLFILVERFNNQLEQYRLAARASEVAQKRYDSSVETFLIGRISTLDLADAQQNKDQTRAKLLEELFLYWYYYYQLRSVTLFDFSTGTNIVADISACVR